MLPTTAAAKATAGAAAATKEAKAVLQEAQRRATIPALLRQSQQPQRQTPIANREQWCHLMPQPQ